MVGRGVLYVSASSCRTRFRSPRATWPVKENLGFSKAKACFGPDQFRVRRYTAIARHIVLVMVALARPGASASRRRLAVIRVTRNAVRPASR